MELSRRMNLKERLYLTSVERYRRFGLVPWDLIVSVLLVAFTTCQIVLIVQNGTAYTYSQLLQWNRLFLNPNVSATQVGPTDGGMSNSYAIISASDLRDYIGNLVDVRPT